MKSYKLLLNSCLVFILFGSVQNKAIGQLYWGGLAAEPWTASIWATEIGGSHDKPWVDGSEAIFNSFSIISGANTNFSSILAHGDVIVVANELLGTNGSVATITVSTGKTFDFDEQNISSAAGTGFIKNGQGVLALKSPGSVYSGGFTLNTGTLLAKGANAMGGGPGNSLTINGGTIAANSDMDFSSHFPNGITVGGNFTIGASSGLSNADANMIFNNAVNLGNNETRTITIGGNGTYTFQGGISGHSSNLIITSNAGGMISLSGSNNYTGTTTLTSGRLRLGGTMPASNNVIVNGGILEIATNQVLNNITVAPGAVLSVKNGVALTVLGDLSINGILECASTAVINGSGNFTLASGATLKTAHNMGISGTISVSGTKTFDSNANYEFQGAGTGVFMTSPTPERVNNLTINRTGGIVSLQQDLTVSGNLILTAGKLKIDGFDLALKNEITGLPSFGQPSSAYIIADGDGKISRNAGVDVLYPIGTTVAYMPCIIDGGDGTFSVSLANLTPGLDPAKTLKKQWIIENPEANSVDMSFQWPYSTVAEGSNFPNSGDVKLYKNNTIWTVVGTKPAPTAQPDEPKTVAFTDIACCSKFSIGAEGAFPVELTEFRIQLIENKTQLTWQTASEINNDFFAVERSKDGSTFQEIGRVAGQGTTNYLVNYRFTDTVPPTGTSYYRLRQVDVDGQFDFSKVVSVNRHGNTPTLLYPSATSNKLTLQFGQPSEHPGELFILDNLGRRISSARFEPGSINLELNVEELASGTYFLSINRGYGQEILRFLKK